MDYNPMGSVTLGFRVRQLSQTFKGGHLTSNVTVQVVR